MQRALVGVGHAITRTTIIMVIALWICMLSRFASVVYFGLLTSTCIILALLVDYFIVPSLILLFRPFGKELAPGGK